MPLLPISIPRQTLPINHSSLHIVLAQEGQAQPRDPFQYSAAITNQLELPQQLKPVFVFYCFIASYHKLPVLKTTGIYYLKVSMGQEAGCELAVSSVWGLLLLQPGRQPEL